MNITYTGKQDTFPPAQIRNMDAKFAKLSKLLDGRGQKQAHVILTTHRGRHRAEITLNYLDHSVVAESTEADQYTAMTSAIARVEKQILKLRAKRRDPKRNGTKQALAKRTPQRAPAAAPEGAVNGKPRVFRVNPRTNGKPMTLDEALIEIGKDGDYVAYRDARSDRLSVLLRRADGNFDLIEG